MTSGIATSALDLFLSAIEYKLGSNNNIPVNIFQTDTGFDLEFVMAGLNKEDIVVEYESSILKVSGQHNIEDKKYLYQGIKSKDYVSHIEIKNIDFENSTAEYRDGILYLKLIKTASVSNRLVLK